MSLSVESAVARLEESRKLHPSTKQTDAGSGSSPPSTLPDWPASSRGVPNVALRSALFSSSRSNRYLERAEIFAQNPTSIRYTGQRLNQVDHNVWITLLHVCRANKLGLPFRSSAYVLLKLQGKTDTGPNRGVLYRCLARLTATAIEISDGKRSYTGSLIDEFYRDEETGELVIELNPKLTGLFGREGFTHIDWSVRRQLTHKPLSQWLHGYFASHADPFPVSIKTLMNMAGSDDACPASAERNLKRALAALAEAHQSLEQPFSYEICEGKVYVHKRPTGSQHRHLRKKLGRQNLAD